MAEVDIRIMLRGGQVDGDRRCYEPSATVQGTVVIFPSENMKCDRVVVALGWHTEGRGNRDKACVGEVEVVRGPLTAHLSVTRDFSFRLPAQPWSHSGHHISIVWDVMVTVDIPFARDITKTEPIVVGPSRLG